MMDPYVSESLGRVSVIMTFSTETKLMMCQLQMAIKGFLKHSANDEMPAIHDSN